MKITFLGTGTSQGTPVIGCNCPACKSTDSRDHRLRTSAIVEINDKTILIDAGPDLRQQLLRENITNIDGIIITHEHRDHVGGLDEVRALNYFNEKPIDVYAEQRVIEAIKADFAYAFAEMPYPGAPEINLIEIEEGKDFNLAGNTITPIRAMHMNLPVLGFRIGNLTYITDANNITDAELKKAMGSKLFVLNALRKDEHISHFSLEQAINIAHKVNAPKTYFTHTSHQMGLYSDIEKELPANIHFAYDTLSVQI